MWERKKWGLLFSCFWSHGSQNKFHWKFVGLKGGQKIALGLTNLQSLQNDWFNVFWVKTQIGIKGFSREFSSVTRFSHVIHFFFQLVQMLQKRSLIVIIFLSLYLTSRMIVKVFRRTVCPQIRVGSCFRSMTLVVNDAMVAIGKKK